MATEYSRYITFDGIDASGKGTLLQLLSEKYRVSRIQAPPKYLSKFRKCADDSNLAIRFLFYSLGNILTDRQVVRAYSQSGSEDVLLQDRSWLTTLTAHELRGLPDFWLQFGKRMAETCRTPDTTLVIHVDEEERLARLHNRNFITTADRENIVFANRIEGGYAKWAQSLRWDITTFDNTCHTPETASQMLATQLNLRKRHD